MTSKASRTGSSTGSPAEPVAPSRGIEGYEYPAYRGYDRQPAIHLGPEHPIHEGDAAWARIRELAMQRASAAGLPELIVVDSYPGTDMAVLREELAAGLPGFAVVDAEDAALPREVLDLKLEHNITDDRLFGVLSAHRLHEFYDAAKLAALRDEIGRRTQPTVVIGWGSALTDAAPDVLVLVDLPRWEIQLRQRAGATNWRLDNADEDRLRKYKRGFFVDWRVADRHKTAIFDDVDVVMQLGGRYGETPYGVGETRPTTAIEADGFWAAMDRASHQPFRVVPFFDPGVWGGQWMREVCDLSAEAVNFAWCFDCVPEENSLRLESGGVSLEIPAIDLVLTRPQELLGGGVVARFGAEFPIRFDLLDTMEGQNLSLQVHPTTAYIQQTFGMHYTQDESYYMLDAAPDATVYLGQKTGIDPEKMMRTLEEAGRGDYSFPAEDYVNILPARKHDHYLIPGGTVHASGRNSLVLEISATPNWFTFKLWDWERVDLDGKPRPINLEHGRANIAWERDTEWIHDQAVDQVEPLAEGDGWREERTGLQALEFIEVRRHWFSGPVPHNTHGNVDVLNLVEGDVVVVSSPTGAFDPYEVHYAETFIVPAAVGEYVIEPAAGAQATEFATVKAYVRGADL